MIQCSYENRLDIGQLAEFAADVAAEGGAQALSHFRNPIAIDKKSDRSPVTEADRATEQLIRSRIAQEFPTHAILGEEFGTQGSNDAPLWVIDPIDGTRSFISGWPIWGTLIALVKEGVPCLGALELPALDESWLGIAGGGSWFRSGRSTRTACRTSGCTDIEQARLYTTSPDYFDETERQAYQSLANSVAMTRFGGDCYSYGLLASGHVDLVLETRLQPYDFLALIPVIEEAGGVITDWKGETLHLGSGEQVVAAATPELHAQALALINR